MSETSLVLLLIVYGMTMFTVGMWVGWPRRNN